MSQLARHQEKCSKAADAARELASHFDKAADAPATSPAAPGFNFAAIMKLLMTILSALGG